MKFKNTTCLKKVWENQAETSLDENNIVFNGSKLSIKDNVLVADVKESEVLFLSKSSKIRKEETRGKRPEFDVSIEWVECISNTNIEKDIVYMPLNVIMITKAVYEALKKELVSDEAIFEELYTVGIAQLSTNLVEVKDFCAVTCNIVDCD